jgi:electron transfer flavoprotein alpha subunit
MKALLICEQRQGKLLESSYELLAFAEHLSAGASTAGTGALVPQAQVGVEAIMLLIGGESSLPAFNGKLYLADVGKYGEYNPDLHKQLIIEAAGRENPDLIVFLHSSYGWDLAPRLAAALKIAQVSEVVNVIDGNYEVPFCNAKLRRTVVPKTPRSVLTIQGGAFSTSRSPAGTPQIERLELTENVSRMEFIGYEVAGEKGVDLTRAEVIVSAGRGIGKKENIPIIAALAKALGGEMGATRPVVDAGWLDHSHQVGTTGQIVHPKLYIACGISGSIQHVAGMKQSDFIVAINKDRDAPIGSVADVLVVADVLQFVPVLTARLGK